MTQATHRRLARDRPALQLFRSEFLRHVLELGLRHLTAADEPAPRLRERDPHEPAAALAGPAGESHERAEGHQVTSQIVDRGHRVELWARRATREQLALAAGDPADRLHHRVEATA